MTDHSECKEWQLEVVWYRKCGQIYYLTRTGGFLILNKVNLLGKQSDEENKGTRRGPTTKINATEYERM